MSTDLLRRAAVLIRERAAAAPDGPYQLGFRDKESPQYRILFAGDGDPIGAVRYWPGGLGRDIGEEEQTAAYITLWHPAVALAVADLLDRWVWMTERYPNEQFPGSTLPQALAAARALLNEETPDE